MVLAVSFVGATPVRFSCRCSRERVPEYIGGDGTSRHASALCGGRGKSGGDLQCLRELYIITPEEIENLFADR